MNGSKERTNVAGVQVGQSGRPPLDFVPLVGLATEVPFAVLGKLNVIAMTPQLKTELVGCLSVFDQNSPMDVAKRLVVMVAGLTILAGCLEERKPKSAAWASVVTRPVAVSKR